MSDMMKQVVQEVIKGNKTIVSNRTNQTNRQAVNRNRNNPSSPLANIKRPNYQQIKKDKRLSFAAKGSNAVNKRSSASNLSGRIKERASESTRSRSMSPKQLNDASISKLSSLSLAQGQMTGGSHYSGGPREKSAKVIGSVKNGGHVLFFPNIPTELKNNFNRAQGASAVGVIAMPDCLPSYLLLVNEVIRNNQRITCDLSWNVDGNAPFRAELYDDDVDRLERIMKDAYQKINRRSLKQYETYLEKSPSTWLSKQLHVGAVDAIALLEEVPYYKGIVLMDFLLKKFKEDSFNFEIKQCYLLLTGNEQVVSKLITALKKEAPRLIST
ncbi:hypothetical protein [Virgibacillus alimentarius]|uniref:Uncharacterized protein n=1 Tax=Virgibacillus alimentarius TaxID=698769 RepID=A0ABS4S6B6_9BACI|nr:hypothetical protein [Virgibacillus alimentarius]MBP2257021.1 hypothetical protein [Virgibacillus alimentarius]